MRCHDYGHVKGFLSLTERWFCGFNKDKPTYHSEVLFELESPTSCGTESSVKAGEVLLAAHLNERVHSTAGEADEMQVPFAPTHGQVFQFQVDIPDPSFPISSIRSQILPDALQVLHFLLFLFGCNILRFEVDQFNQRATDIHAKPREC